jgi:hypothetical protein
MNSLSLAALITHHNVVHQAQVLKTTVQEEANNSPNF